ncbi:uncharacterized protein LOC114530763 [Dendronephthya gigantea]|uniref:uncharacterized protein LOC114530763 n=1 Tax=Dendronephthya gigantea TaxID=151771 RepID=UPI0010690214|nr:uncharacterized protein LOC114530763 [Dendronephthya gigantea]
MVNNQISCLLYILASEPMERSFSQNYPDADKGQKPKKFCFEVCRKTKTSEMTLDCVEDEIAVRCESEGFHGSAANKAVDGKGCVVDNSDFPNDGWPGTLSAVCCDKDAIHFV